MGDVQDQPGHQPKPNRSAKRWLLITAVLTLVLAGLASSGLYLYKHRSPVSAIPQDIVSSVSFTVYAPVGKSNGYSYVTNSAKINSGFLYYKLKNGTKTISVTEQAVPPGVNIHALPKYSDISVPSGRAVIGTSLGNPSVVIVTQTTLVNMISNKAVNKADITTVAQSFKAVEARATY